MFNVYNLILLVFKIYILRLFISIHLVWGGIVMSTKKGSYKIGRDARTDLFIPVNEAKRRKSTTVVETIKRTMKK